MKKIIIAMAAIAAFTMASCNKEQPVSPNENPTVGKSVITASIENGLTKATLEGDDTKGYEVFWSKDDDLFVGELDKNFYYNWLAEYTLEDSSIGSPQGTFSWHAGNTFIPLNESCQEPSFKRGTMYLATYPFDLMEEENHEYLIWKTEQAYADRYIPMYSELECSEDGVADFKFCNLGGVLRLTVIGSASIRSIKISAAEDEAMSGVFFTTEYANGICMGETSFELMDDFGDVFNYIILDCGENGVALTGAGTDFYISIPCHVIYDDENKLVVDGYSDVTITLTDTEGRTCVKKLNNKKLVIERSKITTAKFTASEFKSNVPEGALPGKFSVSADKQVYFSKGNLWADGDNALHFESSQNAFNSNYETSHVSHFTWSSTVSAATGESSNGDNLFCEEIHKVSVDGSEAIYYALSIDEWQYLLSNHTKKWAEINGVNGYVIAPDGFAGTLKDSYDNDAALSDLNLVFLPAAGFRYGSDVINIGPFGFYRSSSALDDYEPYIVIFDSEVGGPDNNFSRNSGCSIRLVTDVK